MRHFAICLSTERGDALVLLAVQAILTVALCSTDQDCAICVG
ncbi:putative inner membrane protein [Candidatus Doolittlea endobia]|uniref:Putative inner membrane protein n=1 Tax=Candidatus Doolittlea endobia TaxID=1778262 RepID=A0A143WRW3_9ENTR|nr:putative inner membrane protein [Candidatus Doolittlea endobia]